MFSTPSPADPTTVLMYHAIDDSDAPRADPHYSVERSVFAQHLRTVHAAGRSGVSVLSLLSEPLGRTSAVALTFDDGLESNRHAADTLAAVGMSADFFVNPSTIGTAGFLTWSDVREMLAMGMSVQSHGMTHRFLDDLSEIEVQREIVDSKDAIEQETGFAVTLFAPPGGRMPRGFCLAAHRAGYRAVCSSVVGYWHRDKAIGGEIDRSSVGGALMVPRLAVLSSTTELRFSRWIANSRREMLILRSRATVLNTAKQFVGNQRYQRLRHALLQRPVR